MRHLLTSSIVGKTGMPLKSGSLVHLQLAYGEVFTAMMIAQIGSQYNPATMYVLEGCINTGSGSNYIISAGAVFFNGEVYLVPAATFTITGPNVAVGTITTGYFADPTADAVTLTDGVPRNVHQVLTVVFAPGLSGSGASNFTNLVTLSKMPIGGIGQVIDWIPPTGDRTWFDGTGLGTNGHVLGWAIANSQNGTINAEGAVTVGQKVGDANFGAFGHTAGEIAHALTTGELAVHAHPIAQVPPGGGAVGVIESGTPNQGISGGGPSGGGAYAITDTDSAGSGTAHNNLQPFVVALKIQRVA